MRGSVFHLRQHRQNLRSQPIYIQNPPSLVIEVVSPNTFKKDTEDLLVEYADARVSEYWIINPIAEWVSVWLLNGQTYTCKGKFKGDQQVGSELLKQL